MVCIVHTVTRVMLMMRARAFVWTHPIWPGVVELHSEAIRNRPGLSLEDRPW